LQNAENRKKNISYDENKMKYNSYRTIVPFRRRKLKTVVDSISILSKKSLHLTNVSKREIQYLFESLRREVYAFLNFWQKA